LLVVTGSCSDTTAGGNRADTATDPNPVTAPAGETTSTVTGLRSTATELERITAGAEALASSLDRIDAASLALVDYVGRRYALSQLSGARVLAEQTIDGPAPSPDVALLRALVVPDSPPPTLAGTPESTIGDALSLALHCVQRPVGDDYPTRLRGLASDNGYGLTHAALALGWMRDLGCETAERNELLDEFADAMVVQLDQAARSGTVTDLTLELSGFLAYVEGAARFPVGWDDLVLAAQRADGGWGQDGPATETSWHTTLLALWTVAAVAGRGEPVPMLIGGASR